jgi:hypothetical protein
MGGLLLGSPAPPPTTHPNFLESALTAMTPLPQHQRGAFSSLLPAPQPATWIGAPARRMRFPQSDS